MTPSPDLGKHPGTAEGDQVERPAVLRAAGGRHAGGYGERFRNVFKDLHCQLAAALHPMFRPTWLEQQDAAQVCSVRGAMESAVETAIRELREDANSIGSGSQGEDGDFFQGITHYQKPETSHSSSRSKAKAGVAQQSLSASGKSTLHASQCDHSTTFVDCAAEKVLT